MIAAKKLQQQWMMQQLHSVWKSTHLLQNKLYWSTKWYLCSNLKIFFDSAVCITNYETKYSCKCQFGIFLQILTGTSNLYSYMGWHGKKSSSNFIEWFFSSEVYCSAQGIFFSYHFFKNFLDSKYPFMLICRMYIILWLENKSS